MATKYTPQREAFPVVVAILIAAAAVVWVGWTWAPSVTPGASHHVTGRLEASGDLVTIRVSGFAKEGTLGGSTITARVVSTTQFAGGLSRDTVGFPRPVFAVVSRTPESDGIYTLYRVAPDVTDMRR